jgi:hypothetical protein
MFPLVPDGTVLWFEENAAIRIGDIVLCLCGGNPVAHRVTSLTGDTVVVWGDWNRRPDRPLARTDVIGRCVLMLRKGSPICPDWPIFRAAAVLMARLLPVLKR